MKLHKAKKLLLFAFNLTKAPKPVYIWLAKKLGIPYRRVNAG